MGAPRKNPPSNALAEIERLAGKGHSTVGLAKFFNVARSVIKRWFEEDERLEEAYEQGRDSYRQALEEQIVSMTLAGKNCAGMIYLLKAKFKMYDQPSSNQKIDVAVNAPQSVLVVKDHGSDEAWAAKVAQQQRQLMDHGMLPALEAPQSAVQKPLKAVSYSHPSQASTADAAPSYSLSNVAWK